MRTVLSFWLGLVVPTGNTGPSPAYNGSTSLGVPVMKIEGLPVINVDESEEITVAVRADD